MIPKICKDDEDLCRHATKMLKKDIELQRVKDPALYEHLAELYPDLIGG